MQKAEKETLKSLNTLLAVVAGVHVPFMEMGTLINLGVLVTLRPSAVKTNRSEHKSCFSITNIIVL